MNLQILSAGLGTRLRPMTNKIPKPALPILGVPMLFYSYHYLRNQKLDKKIVNTFHLADLLKKTIEKYAHDFQFISDGKEILGTGGGIANAKELLQGTGDFWVANGDSVFVTDEDFISAAQSVHQKERAICTLVVTEDKNVGIKYGGVWVDSNDNVLDIGKSRPANAVKGYHFTGFRILSDKVFKYLKKEPSELFDALRAAMKDGHKVSICKSSGEFFETGNPEDYKQTEITLKKYLEQKKYPKYLNSLINTYAKD